MRLSQEEQNGILKVIQSLNFPVEVFLFGSRTCDNKKGGDIDLLITTHDQYIDQLKRLKTTLLVQIKSEIGDQKIDLLLLGQSEKTSNSFYLSIEKDIVPILDFESQS
jgi:predicted nucleotidyltransferase